MGLATCKLLRQNPDVQPTGQLNHSFKTIPIHLIHPVDGFGWLGKSFISSMSGSRLV
jgi:hypothetical protein